MRMRRTIGVLAVVLTFAVPDLLACGDKFLLSGRGTLNQRPKNVRSASLLIYAERTSAMAATIKKADMQKVLKLYGHPTSTVDSVQKLSASVSSGHYDVILTANAHKADVEKLVQGSPDAPTVLAIDELLKNRSTLSEVDKAVVQRDQTRKKK